LLPRIPAGGLREPVLRKTKAETMANLIQTTFQLCSDTTDVLCQLKGAMMQIWTPNK
jgi:hypothetical protein